MIKTIKNFWKRFKKKEVIVECGVVHKLPTINFKEFAKACPSKYEDIFITVFNNPF